MSSRLSAGGRLERLLSIVPFVAARDGVAIDEVAARFDYPRETLVNDLTDVVFMVGLHPYTPDQLVEVVVEDDRVWIRYAEYFARPLRLTPEEGLALVAAGTSLLAAPGADPDGPLARGLAKVAGVLGVEPGADLTVRLAEVPAATLEQLRYAESAHRRCRIDYYAYGRDELSEREIDPLRVFSEQGQWYVVAWCHAAAGERLFRVDRIRSLTVLDTVFEPPAGATTAHAVFTAAPDDPRVTLDLEPAAAWVAHYYPCEEHIDLGHGRVRVRLAVAGTAWLERLLLRLGPDATVVTSAPDLGADVAATAARRILERYR